LSNQQPATSASHVVCQPPSQPAFSHASIRPAICPAISISSISPPPSTAIGGWHAACWAAPSSKHAPNLASRSQPLPHRTTAYPPFYYLLSTITHFSTCFPLTLLHLLRSIPPSHPCGTLCAIHDVMMALHDCMPVKRRRLLVPRLHVRFAASDWSVTVKPGRYRLFRLWPAAVGAIGRPRPHRQPHGMRLKHQTDRAPRCLFFLGRHGRRRLRVSLPAVLFCNTTRHHACRTTARRPTSIPVSLVSLSPAW
jgi:hypothetical protein